MNRWVTAICLPLLILVVAQSTHGQAGGESDINLWPALTVDKDESGSDVRFLIPLGQFTEKDGKEVQAFRPFFIRKGDDDGSHSLDIIWPLVKFSQDAEGDVSRRIFPFIWSVDTDGDRRAAMFPVLWTWWNDHKSTGDRWGVVMLPAGSVQQYGDGGEWSRGIAPLCWAWSNEDTEGFWFAPVFRQKDADDGQDGVFGVLPA